MRMLTQYWIVACLKTTETLLGIETIILLVSFFSTFGLKTTETLLGIETWVHQTDAHGLATVSKLLKPF